MGTGHVLVAALLCWVRLNTKKEWVHARCIRRMKWRRRRDGAACVGLLAAYSFLNVLAQTFRTKIKKLELEKEYSWEGLPLIVVCSYVAAIPSQSPCGHSIHRHTRHTNRVHARVQPSHFQLTTAGLSVAALGVFFSCVRVAALLYAIPVQKSSDGSVFCHLEASLDLLLSWLFGSSRAHVGILQCCDGHVFTTTWSHRLFACKFPRQFALVPCFAWALATQL